MAFVQAEPKDFLDFMNTASKRGLGQAQSSRSAQQARMLTDRLYYPEVAKLEPLVEIPIHPSRLYIGTLDILRERQDVRGRMGEHVGATGHVKMV
ncbi:MAG: hypothetical protein WDN45_19335 [Caulobacteraceae bacterium]